jgi:hypothetical protein
VYTKVENRQHPQNAQHTHASLLRPQYQECVGRVAKVKQTHNKHKNHELLAHGFKGKYRFAIFFSQNC